MSAEELTIAMRLRGARATNAQLNETAGSVDRITAAQKRNIRTSKAFARGMSAAGTTMTRRLTLPIVVGMGFAVKSSLDFHEKMVMLETQAGATAGEVEVMTKKVLDFAGSGKTVFRPGQLADALFFIESHGFRGATAMRKLRAASDFAATGHANVIEATQALTAAQASHIKGTETETKTTATLNAIIGQGAMHMDDLTSAMSTGVLPAANQMGLGLTDVGAALDILTRKGTPAQASATRLRMTFARMVGGTPAVEKALGSIGLTGLQLGRDMRKKNGLLVAVQDLRDHLDSVKDPVKQAQVLLRAFGGGRMSGGIMALVQNVGELRGVYKNMNGQAARYKKSVEDTKNEPINKLRASLSQLEAAGIKLGAALTPVFVALAAAMGGVAAALGGHPKLGISILAALAVIGPLMKLGALAVKVAGAMKMLAGATFIETVATWGFTAALLANPLTWIVLAIVGVIAVLVLLEKRFHLVSRSVKALWGWIKKLPSLITIKIRFTHPDLPHPEKVGWWLDQLQGGHGLLGGPRIGSHAMGGVIQPGERASLVGERGPEIISAPAGSRVSSNKDIVGALRDLGNRPVNVYINGETLHRSVYRVEADRKARR